MRNVLFVYFVFSELNNGTRQKQRQPSCGRPMNRSDFCDSPVRQAPPAHCTGGLPYTFPAATSSGFNSTIASSASFTSIAYFASRFCSSVTGTNDGTGTGLPCSSTATNTIRQSVVCCSSPLFGSPACTDI